MYTLKMLFCFPVYFSIDIFVVICFFIYLKVCSVKCTSPKNFDLHLAGKMHRKVNYINVNKKN